ncbi:Sodium:neurotransmitter symporter family protein [Ancylostoma duodenale]|uniref:Sodium:neurotransmitter symporter family protein n=1 Tax=Ancylostoma duodenale TaxID=51022 RepID=A0A0C2FMV4_9BILA|nr:Sodium:neurotransmitter symporter family protein [Ancylostoma duodenale]
MLIGFFMCTNGGILIMEWLIVYGTTWGLLIAVFCEAMVIAYIYGIKQFVRDLKEMLGFEPGIYWRICWTLLAPAFLLMMILSSFIHYQPLTYQDYEFSPLANILGIFFALSAASAIPIVGLYKFYNAKGTTVREVSANPVSLLAQQFGQIRPSLLHFHQKGCRTTVFKLFPKD